MGMDLEGAGGYFRFSMSSWFKVGELAVMGGWQPTEGTRQPSDWHEHLDGKWEGSYGTNDGGRVSDEDARRMADALERMLPEVPDQGTLERGSMGGIPFDVAKHATVFDWFSGSESKDRLCEFIAYCRKGGFAIH